MDAGQTPLRRQGLRRGIIILPSAFTLGNLFLGIWAIVSASRGEYEQAGWFIVLAAVCDMFDGRVARFTKTGSEFGEELDSLVDAVSFGVAPALITYFLFLKDAGWGWTLAFLYITAAILRLARFNIEQAGTNKSAFHGLPSPTAGVTMATFYAFTQTPLFRAWLPDANVPHIAAWLLVLTGGLMVSNVLYPVVPRFTMHTWGGRLAIVLVLAAIFAAFTMPAYFFFGMTAVYVLYGLVRTVILGFLDRLPEKDPLLTNEENDEGEVRELDYHEIRPPNMSRRAQPPHSEERE